jgi:hypothetical protein
MAFLLSNQNQGTRNDAPRGMRLSRPFSFIRTLTVGFGITPNLLTLLPSGFQENKALAGLSCFTVTAGGDFHRALRTIQFARILFAKSIPTFAEYAQAVQYGRPDGNYAQAPGRQQAPSHRKSAWTP